MELADNSALSDFTKKTLEQFGWKDKEPIPADLGSLLMSFRETLPPSKNFNVLVDATMLNEEQTKQIKDMLAEAKVAKKELDQKEQKDQQQAKLFDKMPPSLAESFKKVLADNPQIIDDRDTTEAATEKTETTATAAAPVEEKVAVAPAPPAPSPTPVNGPPFCPRCGWDMKQKFEITPTDADKEEFLIALLGGQRFRRTYELFGGKVRVTFRSMLAEENKAIYRQLVIDQQAKKIATEAEWFVQMMDYRLACSLDEMTTLDGKLVASVPEVALVSPLPESDENNPLVQQLSKINKDVLAQEVTRRLVGAHLRRFQRLLETLEAQALDPSFWNGIA
jgi:hypothetical protein